MVASALVRTGLHSHAGRVEIHTGSHTVLVSALVYDHLPDELLIRFFQPNLS